MKKLSIIILNYNTKDLLSNCLDSLYAARNEVDFETIVVDNASSDGSTDMVESKFKWVTLIKSDKNIGFSAGNNLAKSVAKGKYILFLNSDTLMKKGTLKRCVQYLEDNEEVGAMTCRTLLPDGSDDKDARRSFPTPWVALTHFSYLDRIFPTSKLFSKYWYGYLSTDVEHEVDVLQGAFFLSPKSILDEVGWFNEEYFLNGEDIDLSWCIKNKGWKIIYYPDVSIIHIKKGTKKTNRKLQVEMSGVKAMEIFYRKRMWMRYPLLVNWFVMMGIMAMKVIRGALHFLK